MSSTDSIETERLLLRPVQPDDLDELVRMHEDPAVARFIGAPERDWLAERIEWSRQEWSERGHGLLAILERGRGEFLVRTGLKFWPQFEETELGWVLQPEARGRGLATEAAAAARGRAARGRGDRVLGRVRLTGAAARGRSRRLLSSLKELPNYGATYSADVVT